MDGCFFLSNRKKKDPQILVRKEEARYFQEHHKIAEFSYFQNTSIQFVRIFRRWGTKNFVLMAVLIFFGQASQLSSLDASNIFGKNLQLQEISWNPIWRWRCFGWDPHHYQEGRRIFHANFQRIRCKRWRNIVFLRCCGQKSSHVTMSKVETSWSR